MGIEVVCMKREGFEYGRQAADSRVPDILRAYMARLRREPLIPNGAELPDADLEDHASTFLADVGQCLVALEKSAEPPGSLLHRWRIDTGRCH